MPFRRTWMCAMTIAAAQMLGMLACQATNLQPSTELIEGTVSISLTPHLSYLNDKNGNDSTDDAWRRIAAGGFQPVQAGSASFGLQQGVYWFHTTLVNHDPDQRHWMLMQRYALLDRIDLYVRYPDGRIVQQSSGDQLPFSARSIPYRYPNFSIELPPGQIVEILVRAQSQGSMMVQLELYAPAAFGSLVRDDQSVAGIFLGILLALFVYNLVLWLSLRDSNYFWCLFHNSAFSLVLFTIAGYSFQYLWPKNPWLANVAVPLSFFLAIIGMQQITRSFLELPKRFPRGNVVSIAIIGLCLALGYASLWLPHRIASSWAACGVVLSVLWTVIVTIVVLRHGYVPARMFLVAWMVFLVGASAIVALGFGLLPRNTFTEYGVQVGMPIEMLLLSTTLIIALNYRYASLRNESERIAAEANLQLERKVVCRTQELSSALMQLEDAHRRLHDSSRRDVLTGLYNRTHFHENFELLLKKSSDQRQPISLLMIDLDHFKSINDHYGHMVGDDCLRWAAQRIGQVLRAHDSSLLARFGGEEFVVILPDHDLHNAVNVAESLCRKLAEKPCVSGPHRVRVSASIGVHTINPGMDIDSDAALTMADQALYAAKANGRDCVQASITVA